MGLFYKASQKELFQLRHNLFLQKAIPVLQQNGFQRSPFRSSWYGKNNLSDYTYTLSRLGQQSFLEIITVHISKDDRWVKTYLNIFELHPALNSLKQLDSKDGMQFWLPPNSRNQMRLRLDDIKGIPLFNFSFLFHQHKLKCYYTRGGLMKRVERLGRQIEKDLRNIDFFVKRWHALHKPMCTDWEGVKTLSHGR